MKKLILAIAFIISTSSLFAQGTTQPAIFKLDEKGTLKTNDSPAFNFDLETYDFGKVTEGPKVSYSFAFTNTGTKPLIIENVKASCGCTTPEWPKEPVLPGQKGVITATYNTSGRPGPFNKAITITSNADTPTKQLFIKGEVSKDATPSETSPIKKGSIVNEK